MTRHTTPSGVVIDVDYCAVCGAPATRLLGFYVLVGPIELPVCDVHRRLLPPTDECLRDDSRAAVA